MCKVLKFKINCVYFVSDSFKLKKRVQANYLSVNVMVYVLLVLGFIAAVK